MPTALEEMPDPFDAAEAHWSTGTIMAIFFAVSLISALFLGLGYSLSAGGVAKTAAPVAISRPAKADPVVRRSVSKPAPVAERRARRHRRWRRGDRG